MRLSTKNDEEEEDSRQRHRQQCSLPPHRWNPSHLEDDAEFHLIQTRAFKCSASLFKIKIH